MLMRIQLFLRALGLRCPNCGGGGLFRHWFTIRVFCPSCGLWLEREPGYFTGAIAMNLVASELVFLISFVAAVALTYPATPWGALQVAAIALMILMPVLFLPFSKTLWIALDLAVRPIERREIVPGFRQPGSAD